MLELEYFLSVENIEISLYAQARQSLLLLTQGNIYNRLTFLNKYLMFLEELNEPFRENWSKFQTAGYLVFWKQFPAAGYVDTSYIISTSHNKQFHINKVTLHSALWPYYSTWEGPGLTFANCWIQAKSLPLIWNPRCIRSRRTNQWPNISFIVAQQGRAQGLTIKSLNASTNCCILFSN